MTAKAVDTILCISTAVLLLYHFVITPEIAAWNLCLLRYTNLLLKECIKRGKNASAGVAWAASRPVSKKYR